MSHPDERGMDANEPDSGSNWHSWPWYEGRTRFYAHVSRSDNLERGATATLTTLILARFHGTNLVVAPLL